MKMRSFERPGSASASRNLTGFGLRGAVGRLGRAEAGLEIGEVAAHNDQATVGEEGQGAGMVEYVACVGAGAFKFGDVQRGHFGIAEGLLQLAEALPQQKLIGREEQIVCQYVTSLGGCGPRSLFVCKGDAIGLTALDWDDLGQHAVANTG